MRRILFLLLGLLLLATTPVQAALQTFSDKAAFLTATGAGATTGPLPNLGVVPSATVGSLTFSPATPPEEDNGLAIGALGVDGWTIGIRRDQGMRLRWGLRVCRCKLLTRSLPWGLTSSSLPRPSSLGVVRQWTRPLRSPSS